MFTPEQVETIDRNARFIIDEHLATLHGVSNRVLQKLTPGDKHEYGKHFEALISETLAAVSTLGDRAANEVPRTVRALKIDLNEQDRDEVLAIWQRRLDNSLYRKRIDAFKESFGRRMQGYGTAVELSTFRFDIVESRYLVGTANAVRLVVAKLKSALDLRVYADREQPAHELPATFLEKANDVVDLKPNLFGFGLNINKLIEHFLRPARRRHDRSRISIALEKPPGSQPPEFSPGSPSELVPDRMARHPSHSTVYADGKVTTAQSRIDRPIGTPLSQLREPRLNFDDEYELLNPDHRHLLSLSRRPSGITLSEIRRVFAIEQERLETALRYLSDHGLVDQSTDDAAEVRWRLSEAGQAFLKANPWAQWV